MRNNVRAIYAWLGSLVLLGVTPLLGLALIERQTTGARVAGVVIGVLGAVPWMIVVATALRKGDEYARRIHLIAFGLAFGGMLIVISTTGWLVREVRQSPDLMVVGGAASMRWGGRVAPRDEAPLRARAVKNRLRDLRASADWSQEELGIRVGVSRQAIIAIETGRFDPSLPLAFKLARVFGLTIEDMFEADGN